MKEAVISKVDGGYLLRLSAGNEVHVSIHTNYGSATKVLRVFFDELKAKQEQE